ncbi:MAG: hypothetical protein K1X83_11895 [Oligoflexia bacterium]|nr:hypothetical protein [Oligoflexia bacterium]
MSEKETKPRDENSSPLISDLMLKTPAVGTGRGDLVVEPEDGGNKDSFALKLEETLRETEQAVLSLSAIANDAAQGKAWEISRRVVEGFKPVPWFIWRLSNFVLGKSGQVAEASEGLVFGMRRLLFAAASDSLLGAGEKVNDVRNALKVVKPDVIAAVSVIHAVCRRLSSRPFERIWRPIVEDALLRARIGYYVGERSASFGAGRGMLAGFSGRSGLAILISSGELEQARQTLEMLATGALIRDVGYGVYRCDPLQVSAMTLSAAGCGRDAAFGTVSYASDDPWAVAANDEQLRWLAAFSLCEAIRMGQVKEIDPKYWELMGYSEVQSREHVIAEARKLVRRGHGWTWIGGM